MGIKLVYTAPGESIVKVPKGYKSLIIQQYPPYQASGGESVKGIYLKDLIIAWFKVKTKYTVTQFTLHDNWYWLYPDSTITACRTMLAQHAPMYQQPKGKNTDGSEYWEGDDCDNKSLEWLRAMWHWSLAGCPVLTFVGNHEGKGNHYYAYVISRERTLHALNGDIVRNKVTSVWGVAL